MGTPQLVCHLWRTSCWLTMMNVRSCCPRCVLQRFGLTPTCTGYCRPPARMAAPFEYKDPLCETVWRRPACSCIMGFCSLTHRRLSEAYRHSHSLADAGGSDCEYGTTWFTILFSFPPPPRGMLFGLLLAKFSGRFFYTPECTEPACGVRCSADRAVWLVTLSWVLYYTVMARATPVCC
jgi:hypothetical protein